MSDAWRPNDPPSPFLVRHADALYEACAEAIQAGRIDARSKIGDATLDYRQERDEMAERAQTAQRAAERQRRNDSSTEDNLPTRVGLCPVHSEEFYYPLKDGESLRCPIYGCHEEMVVYERAEADSAQRPDDSSPEAVIASGEAWQCQCGALTLSVSSTCAACGASRVASP